MYAASLADAFSEGLQNARRAGAGAVRIRVSEPVPGRRTVRIQDDGCGIADPTVLLSFGENGWSEELVAREDAAGMGVLALARRGCRVCSRPAGGEGWSVALEAEHFAGKADARVLADEAAPHPRGTAVEFAADENASAIRRAAQAAARHYPLPVLFEDATACERPEEEVLERTDFLAHADHVEDWQGIRFGVFRSHRQTARYGQSDLNFHGLTLDAQLPQVVSLAELHPCWTVRADVLDCPRLELVLPARQEIVQNAFLKELRDAARLAIYRAMSAARDPRPAFEDWQRARAGGIEIAQPSPRLRPWVPDLAEAYAWNHPDRGLKPLGSGALIVEWDADPREQQAFSRAAGQAGLTEHLFEADRRLQGYEWYDGTGRMADMAVELRCGERTMALDEFPKMERPDAIAFRPTIEERGREARQLELAADLVFGSEGWVGVDEANPLVARESRLSTAELAALLRNAFFSPFDDVGADSWDRQSSDFDRDALAVACKVLLSPDDAMRVALIDAIERDLLWQVPKDRLFTIAILGRDISVSIGPAPEGAGT